MWKMHRNVKLLPALFFAPVLFLVVGTLSARGVGCMMLLFVISYLSTVMMKLSKPTMEPLHMNLMDCICQIMLLTFCLSLLFIAHFTCYFNLRI